VVCNNYSNPAFYIGFVPIILLGIYGIMQNSWKKQLNSEFLPYYLIFFSLLWCNSDIKDYFPRYPLL
jgi:hypothetical protein